MHCFSFKILLLHNKFLLCKASASNYAVLMPILYLWITTFLYNNTFLLIKGVGYATVAMVTQWLL